MENALLAVHKPGSKEFETRMDAAYEKYLESNPSAVLNERIRPEDQDFFDWVMADKESLKATDKIFQAAGIAW